MFQLIQHHIYCLVFTIVIESRNREVNYAEFLMFMITGLALIFKVGTDFQSWQLLLIEYQYQFSDRFGSINTFQVLRTGIKTVTDIGSCNM